VKPARRHRLADNTRDANEDPLIALAQQLGGHFHPGPPLDGWIVARGVWLPVEIKLPEREGTVHEYTTAAKALHVVVQTAQCAVIRSAG